MVSASGLVLVACALLAGCGSSSSAVASPAESSAGALTNAAHWKAAGETDCFTAVYSGITTLLQQDLKVSADAQLADNWPYLVQQTVAQQTAGEHLVPSATGGSMSDAALGAANALLVEYHADAGSILHGSGGPGLSPLISEACSDRGFPDPNAPYSGQETSVQTSPAEQAAPTPSSIVGLQASAASGPTGSAGPGKSYATVGALAADIRAHGYALCNPIQDADDSYYVCNLESRGVANLAVTGLADQAALREAVAQFEQDGYAEDQMIVGPNWLIAINGSNASTDLHHLLATIGGTVQASG